MLDTEATWYSKKENIKNVSLNTSRESKEQLHTNRQSWVYTLFVLPPEFHAYWGN